MTDSNSSNYPPVAPPRTKRGASKSTANKIITKSPTVHLKSPGKKMNLCFIDFYELSLVKYFSKNNRLEKIYVYNFRC